MQTQGWAQEWYSHPPINLSPIDLSDNNKHY